MTLEHLHPTKLSFKELRFVFNVWKQTLKGVWETGKKKPLPESILNKLNFPKNGFHYRCFSANFLKVIRKRRTATLQ